MYPENPSRSIVEIPFRLVAIALGISVLGGCQGEAARARQRVELGKQLEKDKKYEDAAKAYGEAVHGDPRNAEAYYRLALLAWNVGGPPLEPNLRRTLDLDPHNFDALEKLAEIFLLSYQSHHDANWRKKYLAELVDISPRMNALNANAYPSLRLTGYVALYSGDYQKALSSFQAALRTSPTAPSAPRVAADLVRSLTAQGRVAEAESFTESYSARNPGSKQVYEALAEHYETHKQMAEAIAILRRSADKNPKDADARFSLASLLYRAGKTADGDRVLDGVRSDKAAFPQGAEQVGDFYARLGDYPNAVKAYQEGEARQPNRRTDLRLKQVRLLRKQHQYATALQIIEKLDPAGAATPDALVLKQTLLADSGYPQGVDASLRELQTLRQQIPRDSRVALELGRAYQAKSMMPKASELLQTAATLARDSAEPQIALARWNQAQSDYVHMREAAIAATDLDPKDVDVVLVRGIAESYTGWDNEARHDLADVLQRVPGDAEAEYHLARVDAHEGKWNDAEVRFKKLADKGDPNAVLGLADVYTHQKRYPQAMEILRTAMGGNKKSKDLRLAYSSVAVAAGNFDEALAQLRPLKAEYPGDASVRKQLVAAYRGKGDAGSALAEAQAAEKSGIKDPSLLMQEAELTADLKHDSAQAKRLYELVWNADPDNATAGSRLATLMLQTGATPLDALTVAERAARLRPTDQEVMSNLALVYSLTDRHVEASSVYENLIGKNPSDVGLRLAYAAALVRHGNRDKARHQLEAALQKNPQQEQAAAIRAQLDRL
jgi:tetratricopeptide (TPR) repeat protein